MNGFKRLMFSVCVLSIDKGSEYVVNMVVNWFVNLYGYSFFVMKYKDIGRNDVIIIWFVFVIWKRFLKKILIVILFLFILLVY